MPVLQPLLAATLLFELVTIAGRHSTLEHEKYTCQRRRRVT